MTETMQYAPATAKPRQTTARKPPRGRVRKAGHRPARATVLVLWTGYPNGPHVCRSLSRAGFRVLGANPEGLRRSIACLRPRRYPPPADSPDAFLAVIEEICRADGVDAVVPLEEDIVRLLAERGSELGSVTIVGPTAAQYRALCDKAGLARTAQSLGVYSPRIVEVRAGEPTGPWPALPSVVKPVTSTTAGAIVRLAQTFEERDAFVAKIAAEGNAALVQECISGPRWVVHSVRGPGVFEYVAHRVHLEWPRTAGLASIKRPEPPPQSLVSAARRLLEHVDYRGPSGISFLERDGHYYVHDANLRFGGTTGVSIHAGFDWPRRALEVALGLPGQPFSGAWRRGTYMRIDLEVNALRAALTERHGDQAVRVLSGIAVVAVDPRGRLDPSPIDPLGVWPTVGRFLSQGLVQAVRRRRRATAPPPASDQPIHCGG